MPVGGSTSWSCEGLWRNRLCSSPLLRAKNRYTIVSDKTWGEQSPSSTTKSLPFQQGSHLLSSCGCSCLYHSNVSAHHQGHSQTGQTGTDPKKWYLDQHSSELVANHSKVGANYLGSFPFLTSRTNFWSQKQTAAVSSPLISTLNLSPYLWKTFQTICCPLAQGVLSPYGVCLCLFWYLRLLHCLDLPCRLWRFKAVRRSALHHNLYLWMANYDFQIAGMSILLKQTVNLVVHVSCSSTLITLWGS